MSLFPRQRVTEMLTQSANRGIALVVGPAGYGKTEAIRDAFGEVCHYIAIESGTSTVAAMARQIVAVAAPRRTSALGALLQGPDDDERRRHVATWVAAQLRSADRPIVLDDFHHVGRDEALVAFVRAIVDQTAPRVRWVIASREQPDLPSTAWLGRGWMEMPVTEQDLEFTIPEATEVSKACGFAVAEDTIAEICRDTQGWPIAIRLALSAWDRTRAVPPMRLRTREMLFRYLEDEMWIAIDPSDRDFLEHCALLSDLRRAVLGQLGFEYPGATLLRLHRQLPLVQQDEIGNFRLHDLFREFILERQRADHERFTVTLKRVAGVLAAVGNHFEALRLYVEAGAASEIISTLELNAFRLLDSGDRSTVTSAIAALPRDVHDDPVIIGIRGYLQSLDGAWDTAILQMQRALDRGVCGPVRIELLRRLARVFMNQRRGREAVPLLEAVLREIPDLDPIATEASASLAASLAIVGEVSAAREAVARALVDLGTLSSESRAQVLQQLAIAKFYLEDFPGSEALAKAAVAEARGVGLYEIAGRSNSILVSIAEWTTPSTTEPVYYSREMERDGLQAGDRILQIHALRHLYIFAAERGDDEEFGDAERRLTQLGQIRSFYDTMSSRLARVIKDAGLGNHALAITALNNIDRKQLAPVEIALCESLLAVLYATTTNERRSAELLARPVLAAAQGDPFSRRWLAFAIGYRSFAQWLLGRSTVAKRSLRYDADGLTERERVIMSALGSLCSLPRQSMTQRQVEQLTEPLHVYDLGGYARFFRRVAAAAASPVELTRTELDVLRALKAGGTSAEVGDRIGKKENTINSYLKSIIRKIGCSGRGEAISYAEKMGWL